LDTSTADRPHSEIKFEFLRVPRSPELPAAVSRSRFRFQLDSACLGSTSNLVADHVTFRERDFDRAGRLMQMGLTCNVLNERLVECPSPRPYQGGTARLETGQGQ
jgi:hypothetical protein